MTKPRSRGVADLPRIAGVSSVERIEEVNPDWNRIFREDRPWFREMTEMYRALHRRDIQIECEEL